MGKKLLTDFKKNLGQKYLFHIHTNYTDGKLSVAEYLDFAVKNNFHSIIFTEHVRKKMDFDFRFLENEIGEGRKKFPNLNIILGIEAKILPDSDLDLPAEIAKSANLICIACHSFPDDISMYLSVMKNIFKKKYRDKIRIWVHPEIFFIKNQNSFRIKDYMTDIIHLIEIANQYSIFGEKNMRVRLTNHIFPNHLFKNTITGWDIHTKFELNEIIQFEQGVLS